MRIVHDGLIFDLDGTLWDSTRACASGWTEGIREKKPEAHEFSAADLAGIMGMTFDAAVEKLIPDSDPRERQELGEICYQKELEHIRKIGAALYEGVPEGLAELARHYPLFLVSNCLPDYMENFFKMTGLEKLFRDNECFGRTGKAKAHNIRLVAERNQLKYPAYIGDTGSDQQSAILAGATYYHVDYGFGKPSVQCKRFASFPVLVEHLVQLKSPG